MAADDEDDPPVRPVWPADEPCYAHTPGDGGDWHSFSDHARSVGDLAAEFADSFGGGPLARLLGYTHDAGKLTCEVQQALRERALDHASRLGAPHKAEGAALAGLLLDRDLTLACIAHLANFGHHSGMPALACETTTALRRVRRDAQSLDPLLARLNEQLGLDLRGVAAAVQTPDFLKGTDRDRVRLAMDVYARMVHSVLVDADYLDTAAHFQGRDEIQRHQERGMGVLRDTFMDWYRTRFGHAPRSDINDLRRSVFERSVAVGLDPTPAREKRIYRLSAQTGSGKTLAAAAFALNHAARFGKRRVIVAVPFTSITTQNAADYREAFAALGDDVVLEHHSNLTETNDSSWRRLSAENWDAEFIVTTTVQLFESLFSGKPAAARKLHRVANSVVVIDEVQALPLLLVPAILSMLKELVANYGVTLLLASATQPTFWELEVWRELPAPEDIIPHDVVPDVTRRVTYEVRNSEQSWDQIAHELAAIPRVLAIVNTTSDAQALHAAVAARMPEEVLHLSTRMCNQHRRDVLGKVRDLLRNDQPVRLVSTQLIEAGVDVDFPVLYRAKAPADSIVQSAGRCNREGLLGREGGRVVVFESHGRHTPPGLYAAATRLTRRLIERAGDESGLGEPDLMDLYYRELLVSHVEDSDASAKVQDGRRRLDFPQVADDFRMIRDAGAPVVITKYGSDTERRVLKALLEGLRTDPTRFLRREDRRFLQRFSATVPARHRERWAEEITSGVWVWRGDYDDMCGAMLQADASIW